MRHLWVAFAICCQASVGQADTCSNLRSAAEALPAVQGKSATCTTSRTLGQGASNNCYWSFGLRDEAAGAAFEAVSQLVAACADAPMTIEGASVNHPDSFDQITGRIGGKAVSVSLKDKGGLGQTVVFLRQAQEGSPDQ
ncbi:MAG: hypothetical protein AB8B60_19300 [Sulfitobacter sp.]